MENKIRYFLTVVVANENMLGRSFLGSKLSPPLKRYEKFHYGELRLQNGILSSRPLFFCSHATCVCQGTQNILTFKRASCFSTTLRSLYETSHQNSYMRFGVDKEV